MITKELEIKTDEVGKVFIRTGLNDPFVAEETDEEVMCECGNKAFTLNYGSYEVFGTCTKCGKRYSIYSG